MFPEKNNMRKKAKRSIAYLSPCKKARKKKEERKWEGVSGILEKSSEGCYGC
jgi:hypothetical protein